MDINRRSEPKDLRKVQVLPDFSKELVFGGWTPFFRKGSRAKRLLGAHSAGEIPVYIPNTEVKPSRGDYTAPSGKLARCQIIRASHPDGWLFVVGYNYRSIKAVVLAENIV